MKKEIVNYLLEKGIRPNLKGFSFLHRAIEMTIENGNILPKMCAEVYSTIAKEFNESPAKIERAIRNAIKTSKTKDMTNGEFIANASLTISMDKE